MAADDPFDAYLQFTSETSELLTRVEEQAAREVDRLCAMDTKVLDALEQPDAKSRPDPQAVRDEVADAALGLKRSIGQRRRVFEASRQLSEHAEAVADLDPYDPNAWKRVDELSKEAAEWAWALARVATRLRLANTLRQHNLMP